MKCLILLENSHYVLWGKEYIKIKIVYKEISKEILKRVLTPINKYVNVYKQNRIRAINTDVKDIIKNNNINYNEYQRDYNENYKKIELQKR